MGNRIINSTTSTTYYDSDLYGGVDFSRVLNADTNLQVGDVSSASIKFKVKVNAFTVDDELVYYLDNGALVLIGTFYVTEINKGKTDYTITAYDAVSKLDADSTEWKRSLTLPMTLREIFRSMATYLGIRSSSSSFTNSTLTFNTNYLDDGLSYRQILSYIAQAAGGFAYMDNHYLSIGHFNINQSEKTFTSSNYKTLEQADYIVPAIDGVWLGIEDGDVGVSCYGSSEASNILKIYNNPFLYIDDVNTESVIQTAVDNIYNVVSQYTYRPFKLETFVVNASNWKGKKININGEDTIPFLISWNKSGVTYESTGDPSRDKVPMFSAAEQRMSGKYNILTRSVKETRNEIGNVRGDVSTLSQTVDGVQITLQYNIDQLDEELSGEIDSLSDDLDEHARLQKQYIRYGASGLELGKEGDPIKANLTNSELAFSNNSTKVAYISSDELYTSKVRVVGPQRNNVNAILTIGEWQFIRRSDGSLDIKRG